MTIKHLGGIFGRNPEFNTVEVDSTSSVGTFDTKEGYITQEATSSVYGENDVTISSTQKGIFDVASSDGVAAVGRGPSLTFTNSISKFVTGFSYVGSAVSCEYALDLNGNKAHNMYLWAADTSGLEKKLGVLYDGNIQIVKSGAAIEWTDGGPIWLVGAGTPEGNVTADVGSLFTRTNGGAGTTLYVKESGTGNTGWVAK